jgi:hypothetical protein
MSDQSKFQKLLENARFELDTTSSHGTGDLIARTVDGVLIFRRNHDGSGWSEFDPEAAEVGDAVTKITDTALLRLLEAQRHTLKPAVLRITKLSNGVFSVVNGTLKAALCNLDGDTLTPNRIKLGPRTLAAVKALQTAETYEAMADRDRVRNW